MFWDWKKEGNTLPFKHCFSLNFGYHENTWSFPQIAMTPESSRKLIFDFPSSCFFVFIGGKYINRIGDVMDKVDSVTNDIRGNIPLAVFLISNNYKENIKIDHGFERYRLNPVMVKYLFDDYDMNSSSIFIRFNLTIIKKEQNLEHSSRFIVQVNMTTTLIN